MSKGTVVELLHHAVSEFPNRAYVAKKTDLGWTHSTFRDIYDRARAFASYLLSAGFKKGDRLAIFADGSPEWVVAELGTFLAGGVTVPLSFKLLPAEIEFRLTHSEASMLAVSGNTLDRACSVLSGQDRPVRLVYLEDDPGPFAESQTKYRIPGENGMLFADCLAQGKAALDETLLARLEEELAEQDLATISYTSGTAGNPKGVMLTHGNYFQNSRDSVDAFNIRTGKFQTLLILPCDHSFAHTVGMFCALHRGISVYFVDSRNGPVGMARNIPTNLGETNPIFLLTVPALTGSFMKRILANVEGRGELVKLLFSFGLAAGIRYRGDGFNLPPFRVRMKNFFPYWFVDKLLFSRIRRLFGNRIGFFVGGGALHDMKQQEFFQALGIPLYQGYGLTEASPVIAANTQKVHKLGTSGKILSSVSCKILKADGKPAGIDEIGEICVQGKTVMKGYYKNEEATAEVLKHGWLHTGDLGCIDEDGFLVVAGREKALLISTDGEKYSPEEIEEALVNASPVVRQALLFNDHRKYTSALVVLDEEATKKLIEDFEEKDPSSVLAALTESVFAFKKDAYYGRRFPTIWLPTTFRFLEEPFTEENTLINSTLKMVRFRIHEKHKDEIEYLYTAEGSQPLNPANLAYVKKRFGL